MKNKESEGIQTFPLPHKAKRGTGPGSAGQSGDTEGLSDVAEAGNESVAELVEEGQYAEAALIESMEKDIDGELHLGKTPDVDPTKKRRHRGESQPL